MLIVVYSGRPAAVAHSNGIQLSDHIAVLEPDHPSRRWVTCLAIFALDVLAGRIDGTFTANRAGLFARCVLLPDEEFGAHADNDDSLLAEYFNVPLPQIAEKRTDLAVRAIYGTDEPRAR